MIQQFDFSINAMQALLWQHSQAVNLPALIQATQDWHTENHTDFWNNWRTDVFDLRTANDFGLAVWSIILDLPLFNTGEDFNLPVFGFDVPVYVNFDQPRSFFAPSSSIVIEATTEQKRFLLRLRFFKMISRATPPEVNRFLQFLFGSNQMYMTDGLDMTVTYTLAGAIPIGLRPLFELLDVLPRPTGVSINFVEAP